MRPLVISPNAPLRHRLAGASNRRSPARALRHSLPSLAGSVSWRPDESGPRRRWGVAPPTRPEPRPFVARPKPHLADRELPLSPMVTLPCATRASGSGPSGRGRRGGGLGSRMHRSPAQRPERVARVLGLPQSSHAVFRLCVGWPPRPCPCSETISPANETQDETSDPAPC
jgi:hypothetical protein